MVLPTVVVDLELMIVPRDNVRSPGSEHSVDKAVFHSHCGSPSQL
jgi:hypothetical protein